MYDIGIMQGRLLPENQNLLNIFPKKRWIDEIDEAKTIGFNYIEFLYDVNQEKNNPLFNISLMPKLIEEINNVNIEVYSICADYFTEHSLISDKSENSISKLTKLVNLGSELNIELIVLPLLGESDCKNKTILNSLINKIRPIIDIANSYGISISIETSLESSIVLEVLKNHNYEIGICFDLGNATAYNFNIFDEIIQYGHSINHIHIKDRLRNNGSNVLMGKGNVDFTSAFNALNKIKYSGNFTLETNPGNNPNLNARENLLLTKNLISKL